MRAMAAEQLAVLAARWEQPGIQSIKVVTVVQFPHPALSPMGARAEGVQEVSARATAAPTMWDLQLKRRRLLMAGPVEDVTILQAVLRRQQGLVAVAEGRAKQR